MSTALDETPRLTKTASTGGYSDEKNIASLEEAPVDEPIDAYDDHDVSVFLSL